MRGNARRKYKEEDPLELTRRLRRELMREYDNDLEKIFQALKEHRKKNPGQYIDLKDFQKK